MLPLGGVGAVPQPDQEGRSGSQAKREKEHLSVLSRSNFGVKNKSGFLSILTEEGVK